MPGKTFPDPCPECGGAMWDNRENKRNPRAPDARCKDKNCEGVIWPDPDEEQSKPKTAFQGAKRAMQEPPQERSQHHERASSNGADIKGTRAHIMKAANLYVLCVDCVNNFVGDHIAQIKTADRVNMLNPDLFQAAVSTLFIEASGRRTDDGVNWWSYVDKMPSTPIEKISRLQQQPPQPQPQQHRRADDVPDDNIPF